MASTTSRRALGAAERTHRAQEARERLRTELRDAVALFKSHDTYRAWLSATARLHRYSPTNALLIFAQAHARGLELDVVAPLRTWGRLGFHVRKGERGMIIRRPVVRRDDVRALEDRDEDAPPRAVAFRAGYVFCRSQVEPMPGRTPAALALPEPSIDGAEHRHALERLGASLSADGWRLDRAELPRGVEGQCNTERRQITLSRGLAINAQLRVLVHEASHAEGVLARSHGRERAECIVEAATYIVCARLGLDVQAASVPYIAGWEGADGEVLERDAGEINRVALAVERRLKQRESAERA